MKIKVTKAHILRGRKRICSRCPVAIAVMEATGAMEGQVSVGAGEISIRDKTYKQPPRVSAFISRFDRGTSNPARFRPFSFSLGRALRG